jgi:hypothetical protein
MHINEKVQLLKEILSRDTIIDNNTKQLKQENNI